MPTTTEAIASSPASVVAPSSPASITFDLSATAISPLLSKVPLEIREQIYRQVFVGSVMLVSGPELRARWEFRRRNTVFAPSPIPGSICSQTSFRIHGPANYKVLLTCKAIYLEARPILASSLNIYTCCLDHTAVKQIICALKHDTFLRYVIPHIQCLNVLWELDAVVPILQQFSSLQNVKVKAWEVFSQRLEMSAEEFLSPQSDQKLIRWVESRISHKNGMMKSIECPDRRFKIQARCGLFPYGYHAPYSLKYVRAYSP